MIGFEEAPIGLMSLPMRCWSAMLSESRLFRVGPPQIGNWPGNWDPVMASPIPTNNLLKSTPIQLESPTPPMDTDRHTKLPNYISRSLSLFSNGGSLARSIFVLCMKGKRPSGFSKPINNWSPPSTPRPFWSHLRLTNWPPLFTLSKHRRFVDGLIQESKLCSPELYYGHLLG